MYIYVFIIFKLAYINKTRPKPCDKEVNLYKLNNSKLKETNSDKYKPVKGKLSNCHSNGCGRFVDYKSLMPFTIATKFLSQKLNYITLYLQAIQCTESN